MDKRKHDGAVDKFQWNSRVVNLTHCKCCKIWWRTPSGIRFYDRKQVNFEILKLNADKTSLNSKWQCLYIAVAQLL